MQRILYDAYPDKEKQANEVLLFLGKLTPAIQAAKNYDYREYRRALFGAIQTKISTLKDALAVSYTHLDVYKRQDRKF